MNQNAVILGISLKSDYSFTGWSHGSKAINKTQFKRWSNRGMTSESNVVTVFGPNMKL